VHDKAQRRRQGQESQQSLELLQEMHWFLQAAAEEFDSVRRSSIGSRCWTSLLHATHFASWLDAGHRDRDLPPICARHTADDVTLLSACVTPENPHYWRLCRAHVAAKRRIGFPPFLIFINPRKSEIAEGSSLSQHSAVCTGSHHLRATNSEFWELLLPAKKSNKRVTKT
jgi:hypothetical protein